MVGDGTVDVPPGPGRRPGPLGGGRAAAVGGGDGVQPPPAWAPAVLAGHALVLALAVVLAQLLSFATSGAPIGPEGPGRFVGPPLGVQLAVWAVAVVAVVVTVRRVGRRRPGRLAYWLSGTACWLVVPLAWVTVAGAAADPAAVGWSLVLFVLTPYGWVFLLPLLVIGAVWTLVLAVMSS